MKIWAFAAIAASVVTASSAGWAQPVGTFNVIGRNPGASGGPPAYTGTIAITANGGSFDVVWTFGSVRVLGRGLFVNGVFSVAYPNRRPAGVAIVSYVARPDGTWEGRWVLPGNPNFGTELLTRP
jgi:hypothetical protein